MSILSTRDTKPLDQLEINYIYDPRGKQVVDAFRDELAEICKNVEKREKIRKICFQYDVHG